MILTVDDEREITDLIRIGLTEAGYDVESASNSREALAIIHTRRPDLILLDLMLPDIDGLSLFEILRDGESTASIPVVILTGWSTDDARKYGSELGAVDYLNKPLKLEVLIDRVRRILASHSRGDTSQSTSSSSMNPGRWQPGRLSAS
ncbi:MAG: response regulator [Opitutaceae bacterium]|nr:response regulator [Opitutaceae bacterium]